MNLPYPFDKASDVKADVHGAISLIDDQGKALARIPMTTAFELSPEVEGHGYGDDYGTDEGFGDGYGDGTYGQGSYFGSGCGFTTSGGNGSTNGDGWFS
jgi:hypothetical protein